MSGREFRPLPSAADPFSVLASLTGDRFGRMHGRRADEIAGYLFAGDVYCPRHVVDVLPTGEGGRFDGWAVAEGADPISTEDNLNEIALAFGIDRDDETSFDSDEFPKVLFASDDSGDTCAVCGDEIR